MATPTKERILDALDLCIKAQNEGSAYRGMSYEDGVEAAIRWLTDDDEFPFDE
mgnify:CR=1 FL=1